MTAKTAFGPISIHRPGKMRKSAANLIANGVNETAWNSSVFSGLET
jgi:hypothetical protein